MEDLNKIQEFFSKPVKENSRRSPDFILTEPAEIKYTESFGTGIKAPGVLHHANEGVFLGAEGAYIIVLPGGTFYVDEDTETAMLIWPLKDQTQELHQVLDYTPFSPKYETWKSWIKRPNVLDEEAVEELNINDPVAMKMRAAKDKLAKMRAANAGDDGNDKFFEKSTARLRKLKSLKDKRAQIMRDMEQEAELEGGPVADKYGDMLNKLDKAISMLDEAVNDPRIDNSKFGPSPRKFAELRAQMGDEALLDKIQMMDVNILVDVLDELSLMQESTIVNEYDVSIPSQEEVDQFFQDNITLGTHYLNRKPVMGQKGSFNKTEIAPWDEADYSNWKTLVAKSLKEEEGYSQFLKTDDNPEGKTKGLDTKTMNKILMNVIKDLDELKQLGEGVIEEELCAKGKAYIKKRQAAGEKSSAYLSGRAVKVCKGQMKG